jgi:hypothetical protein
MGLFPPSRDGHGCALAGQEDEKTDAPDGTSVDPCVEDRFRPLGKTWGLVTAVAHRGSPLNQIREESTCKIDWRSTIVARSWKNLTEIRRLKELLESGRLASAKNQILVLP